MLTPHSPDYVSDFCLPYDYDPEAQCPLWEEKLLEILEYEDKVDLLQEIFGYCLTSGQPYHKVDCQGGKEARR